MGWYVIHTKPHQEARAEENLARQGFDCLLPLLRVEKLRRGKVVVESEPLFPRYLFVRLGTEPGDPSWAPIRSTKGVNKLVRFGDAPAQVDDGLIDLLRRRMNEAPPAPERLFAPGERVTIVDGPFAGIEGVFQMAEGERRAMVLIDLLGRTTGLGVGVANLRKVV